MQDLINRLTFKIEDFQAKYGPSHFVDAKSLKNMLSEISSDIDNNNPVPTIEKITTMDQYEALVSLKHHNRNNVRKTDRGFLEYYDGSGSLIDLITKGNLIHIQK